MKKFIFVGIFSLLIVFSFSKVYVEDGMVVFEYENPTADTVFVAGTFNNWSTSAWEMEYYEGVWVYVTNLQPGVYEYKYVVNGTDWYEDPESPDYVPDPYGGRNSKFELILVNGKLQIVTGLSEEEGASSFISGEYKFGLKTKLEEETGFFAGPKVSNEVVLSLNPNVQNSDLELKIGADSTNYQFKVLGMKAFWGFENLSFGAFYKSEVNPNYVFEYENPEKKLPGFGFFYNWNDLNVGLNIYSQSDKLKYGVFGSYFFGDYGFSVLFDTVDSTSLVFRGDVFDFYAEVEMKDLEFDKILAGYEKEDKCGINLGYSMLNEDLMLDGYLILGNIDVDGAAYYEMKVDNFFAVKVGAGYTLSELYRIGGNLYYNADENFGYDINFKVSGDDIPVELKVSFGNQMPTDDLTAFEEDKYLSFSLIAEF